MHKFSFPESQLLPEGSKSAVRSSRRQCVAVALAVSPRRRNRSSERCNCSPPWAVERWHLTIQVSKMLKKLDAKRVKDTSWFLEKFFLNMKTKQDTNIHSYYVYAIIDNVLFFQQIILRNDFNFSSGTKARNGAWRIVYKENFIAYIASAISQGYQFHEC